MSKIVFKLSPDTQNLNGYLMLTKRITDQSLGEIKERVMTDQPLAEFIIFENDHDKVVDKIRRLIMFANDDENNLLQIYELESEEAFDSADLDESEISIETLLNILTEFDREREFQRELSIRELGED